MGDVQLSGFPDLERALQDLARVAQRQSLQAAVRAGAEPIQEAAARNAPRLTGGLSENIIISFAGEQNTIDSVACKVGPDKRHFYGKFQQKGQFLLDAFNQQLNTALERIRIVLKHQIEKRSR